MANQQSKEKVVYVGDSRVRKGTMKNIPKDYSSFPGKSEAFVPNFLLKEWMVGAVVLVGFMALIIAHPAPLGYPADPTNTAFIPIPDWYFLFLYQFIKYPYVSEQFVVFGVAVVPALAFGGLLLAPFLDTGRERRWYKRPIASGFMFLSLAAIIYLTNVAWVEYQNTLAEQQIIPEHIDRAERIKAGELEPGVGAGGSGGEAADIAIVDADDPAFEIYQAATCLACHGSDMAGVATFPPLRGIGDKYTQEEIIDIMKNGIGSMTPQWDESKNAGNLTDEQLEQLAEWLARQKADGAA